MKWLKVIEDVITENSDDSSKMLVKMREVFGKIKPVEMKQLKDVLGDATLTKEIQKMYIKKDKLSEKDMDKIIEMDFSENPLGLDREFEESDHSESKPNKDIAGAEDGSVEPTQIGKGTDAKDENAKQVAGMETDGKTQVAEGTATVKEDGKNGKALDTEVSKTSDEQLVSSAKSKDFDDMKEELRFEMKVENADFSEGVLISEVNLTNAIFDMAMEDFSEEDEFYDQLEADFAEGNITEEDFNAAYAQGPQGMAPQQYQQPPQKKKSSLAKKALIGGGIAAAGVGAAYGLNKFSKTKSGKDLKKKLKKGSKKIGKEINTAKEGMGKAYGAVKGAAKTASGAVGDTMNTLGKRKNRKAIENLGNQIQSGAAKANAVTGALRERQEAKRDENAQTQLPRQQFSEGDMSAVGVIHSMSNAATAANSGLKTAGEVLGVFKTDKEKKQAAKDLKAKVKAAKKIAAQAKKASKKAKKKNFSEGDFHDLTPVVNMINGKGEVDDEIKTTLMEKFQIEDWDAFVEALRSYTEGEESALDGYDNKEDIIECLNGEDEDEEESGEEEAEGEEEEAPASEEAPAEAGDQCDKEFSEVELKFIDAIDEDFSFDDEQIEEIMADFSEEEIDEILGFDFSELDNTLREEEFVLIDFSDVELVRECGYEVEILYNFSVSEFLDMVDDVKDFAEAYAEDFPQAEDFAGTHEKQARHELWKTRKAVRGVGAKVKDVGAAAKTYATPLGAATGAIKGAQGIGKGAGKLAGGAAKGAGKLAGGAVAGAKGIGKAIGRIGRKKRQQKAVSALIGAGLKTAGAVGDIRGTYQNVKSITGSTSAPAQDPWQGRQAANYSEADPVPEEEAVTSETTEEPKTEKVIPKKEDAPKEEVPPVEAEEGEEGEGADMSESVTADLFGQVYGDTPQDFSAPETSEDDVEEDSDFSVRDYILSPNEISFHENQDFSEGEADSEEDKPVDVRSYLLG